VLEVGSQGKIKTQAVRDKMQNKVIKGFEIASGTLEDEGKGGANMERKKERTTYLRISRVRVKHVAEKLAGNGNPCYNQAVDVVRVDDKGATDSISAELRHAVKVDQQREENVICRGAVFQNPKQVSF
jgi:hypothetical protein